MLQTDIAVIGSGFSAATTIAHLFERLEPAHSVGIVGRTKSLGLGTAYSTRDEVHRLNVPAGRMSLYAEKPDHLTDWLQDRQAGLGPEDFIPRRDFGRYVQDTLAGEFHRKDNRAEALFLDADALDCEQLDDDAQVFHLASGERLSAGHSIFCLGGTPAGLPIANDRIASDARKHICLNVWASDWMERIAPADTIFMLGSGLTMIDQVMSLKRRGHQGPIHVVSRHGLVPLPHHVPRSHPIGPVVTPGSTTLSHMMMRLRQEAAKAEDWRSVVDGIRPITQALWQHLDLAERQRFLRHAHSWWSIHRHRMAPDMAAEFEVLRSTGQVTVHAGWLQEVYENNGRARVAYKDRATGTFRQLSTDWVINCTGMEKCSISKVPLLKKMSARGMITGDALGLGVAVTQNSEIIRQDGRTVTSAFAMGPMVTGQFFEIFAVPDIRAQASKVAQRIADRIA